MSPKTILVTGASSGIGHEICRQFLESGAQVIATLRDAQNRQHLFEPLKAQFGDRLWVRELDVRDPLHLDPLVQLIQESFASKLDGLVLNAGVGQFGPSEWTSERDLAEVFSVNYFGSVRIGNALLPFLRAQKGHIFVISSVFGAMGFPLTSGYCASKFALEGHFEALAMEVAPFGVKVTIVQPGAHKTQFMTHALWQTEGDQAYLPQVRGYQCLQQKLRAKGGADPRQVAKRVVAEAFDPKAKVRVVVGKDVMTMRLMRKALPRNRFVKLVGAMCARSFVKQSQKLRRGDGAGY